MADNWNQREVAELIVEMRKHGCIPHDLLDEIDQLVDDGAIYDAIHLILDST